MNAEEKIAAIKRIVEGNDWTVKIGKWIKIQELSAIVLNRECPFCISLGSAGDNYCAKCGAKLKEPE